MRLIKLREMLEAISGGMPLGKAMAGTGINPDAYATVVPAEALVTETTHETELVVGLLREHRAELERRIDRMHKTRTERMTPAMQQRHGAELARTALQLALTETMLATAYPDEESSTELER